jgi:hypothetical protein
VAGTRVSLDSLLYAFREGHTAETMAQSFPALTLCGLEATCTPVEISGLPLSRTILNDRRS